MKNLLRTDESSIEQCFAANIVQGCQQYCSAMLHLIQAQQYCLILLIVQNSVASKIFFNPVLTNHDQVVHFLLCNHSGDTSAVWEHFMVRTKDDKKLLI